MRKYLIFQNKNWEQLLGIIDAFRRHTSFEGDSVYEDIPLYNTHVSVDYTGAGGDFAAWVRGHEHKNIV